TMRNVSRFRAAKIGAGSVSHGHGHSRLAESGGRGGAGGPTCACTPTMTGVHHAFSELMASFPHRQSLSLGPEGKSTGTDESWFGQFSSIHPLLSHEG